MKKKVGALSNLRLKSIPHLHQQEGPQEIRFSLPHRRTVQWLEGIFTTSQLSLQDKVQLRAFPAIVLAWWTSMAQ